MRRIWNRLQWRILAWLYPYDRKTFMDVDQPKRDDSNSLPPKPPSPKVK